MASCSCELFIWSLKNQYAIPDEVIGCHSFHDKGEPVCRSELPYNQEKQEYLKGRDHVWTPRNKRPDRLRDNLKEVEELLSQYKCVQIRWRSLYVLQLLMANASVITFIINGHGGDIARIFIDKSLVGKLSSEVICDGHINEKFLVASYSNINKLDVIIFTKIPALDDITRYLEKIAAMEPKIIHVEIPGPKSRRIERHFSVNTTDDMVLVWWSLGCGEAWPWSPMSSTYERSNIIVITVHGTDVDITANTKTDCDPHEAQFSKLQPHKIFSVEQELRGQDDVVARSCTYEVIQGEIQTASVVTIPLKSKIVCQERNPTEDRLLLGLLNATLVMYDEWRRSTLFTRAAFPPSSIAWHPNGTLFVIASTRADFQIFDRALSPLRIHLCSEDPSPDRFLRVSKFFRTSVTVRTMQWCPFDPFGSEYSMNCTDFLALSFSSGPVGLMEFHLGARSRERLSTIDLIEEYLKHHQIDEAVNFLESMNWEMEGQACYGCLSAIINFLLRMTLNQEREGQLQAALATFYSPKPAISEATILEYRDPISQLARRFFQQLLRYFRFDKAFLLAVDIGTRDVFMDIHYMAVEKGETVLAEIAKKKAEQVQTHTDISLQGLDDGTFLHSTLPLANHSSPRGHNSHHSTPYPHSRHSDQKDAIEESSPAVPEFDNWMYPGSGADVRQDQDRIVDDYTAALMYPGTQRFSGLGRHQHREQQQQEKDRSSRNVDGKVDVHFGIV